MHNGLCLCWPANVAYTQRLMLHGKSDFAGFVQHDAPCLFDATDGQRGAGAVSPFQTRSSGQYSTAPAKDTAQNQAC